MITMRTVFFLDCHEDCHDDDEEDLDYDCFVLGFYQISENLLCWADFYRNFRPLILTRSEILRAETA